MMQIKGTIIKIIFNKLSNPLALLLSKLNMASEITSVRKVYTRIILFLKILVITYLIILIMNYLLSSL